MIESRPVFGYRMVGSSERRGITRGHRKLLGGDENVHYLEYSNEITDILMSKFIKVYTANVQFTVHQSYFNKTDKRLTQRSLRSNLVGWRP